MIDYCSRLHSTVCRSGGGEKLRASPAVEDVHANLRLRKDVSNVGFEALKSVQKTLELLLTHEFVTFG